MTIQKIEEVEIRCNNCNKSRPVSDDTSGEIACSSCGCVISEYTEDRGVEHGSLADGIDNRRTGAGMTLKTHDKGLYTIIAPQNRDSIGKPISSNNVQVFSRLRKWDSRSQIKSSADRSIRIALQDLSKAQSKLGLSDSIIERASLFYRKASEKNLVR
ncbi:MAG: transcription initiation factor IIB, partial [Candidatus Nitrosomaritimum yanchengensis]